MQKYSKQIGVLYEKYLIETKINGNKNDIVLTEQGLKVVTGLKSYEIVSGNDSGLIPSELFQD